MRDKRKLLIFGVLALMVLAIVGVASYYWYENTYFVNTEDARVSGDIFRAYPQISGKLLEFNAEEGQLVQKGQILGRQEMNTLPDTSLEMSIVRAPITGLIIKKQANVDEVVSPGQTLAMLVDPNKLYISANLEETNLGKIKAGQTVDISVDQYPNKKFTGRVDSIGEATAATFSMLPSSTSANFTKVVQKVSVKIALVKSDVKLLPGTNAVIKIHIK
jgi:multidrug resistance efflux pump